MPNLSEQIKCVGRELYLRRNVYRKWVKDGRMTRQVADREIETMEAVLATLQKLAASKDSKK